MLRFRTRPLAPFLLVAALSVAATAIEPTARAQQAQEKDSLTEQARELYRTGMAYMKAKDYERARAAFVAAWGVKQHWSIALSLGQCELELGLPRDAAEHLDQGLRELPSSASGVDRPRAESMLRRAQALVGAARITVNVDGAEVFVDGKSLGRSPFAYPVYVEPGSRTFEARVPARETARAQIELRPGATSEVALAVPTDEVAPPVVSPASGNAKPAPSQPRAPGTHGQTPVEPRDGNSASTARTVVAVSGVALTAVAVGAALVYRNKASNAEDDASSLQSQIRTQLGPSGCTTAPNSPLCTDLKDKRDERDAAQRTSTVAWVGAGVLLVSTATAYLLWPEAKQEQGQPVSWSPAVLPRGAGFTLEGRF